ncbi:DUF5105 domain-containing protein [Carnobacterium divergens]|uniref:DUF5105 domain-containing protein n=1 Tax=Carnobacterium divergens TaxID=2748 RepID=A0AAW8RGW4_CARDV|nr:DUF5105 domain-containing protein [Carnobacterium divergens]MDT1959451.1 DUF5105 domain-containing protein [Carnobacterium divergens]MDT1975418.1 DUF5105 domain-containing protein [Carnobacterium divergens]
MKKKMLLLSVLLITLVVAGCGGNTKNSKSDDKPIAKSKVAEVQIEKGEYVVPFSEDGEGGSDTYIALQVKVKNKSKEQMYITADNFALYEKGEDEKINPITDYKSGFKTSEEGGKLSADKSLKLTILFNVKKDKEYSLNFATNSFDEDNKKDVELAVDQTQYKDSLKKLDEPKKALDAYMDVVFLNKENENYDNLVSTNSEEAIAEFKKAFNKVTKDYVVYNYKPTDDELTTLFKNYQETEAKRATIETKLLGNTGEKALVEVKFKGLSNDSIIDIIREYKEEYNDENDTYDSEKSEQYALTKYPEILEKSELGEPRNDIKVLLTKKDGKWDISMKSNVDASNENLLRAFTGNVD